MEERAPYCRPHNLTHALAEWLRTQGWAANLSCCPDLYTVMAYWYGPQQERFELTYQWQPASCFESIACLQVLHYGQLPETLFSAQRVRRLREVRLLLLGNVRYHNARLLAKSAPVSAAS